MRWSIEPGPSATYLDLPGCRLGAERVRGLVRLVLERGGSEERVDVACRDESPKLSVRFRLPKPPVLFIADPAIVVPAESIVLLGADLPLDVAVEDRAGTHLWEFVSPEYRKAWSGDLDGGEGGFALAFEPRIIQKPLDARPRPGRAGLSVLVANQGRRRTSESRFSVPTRNLRLYEAGNEFICDGVAVVREPEGGSRTTVRALRSIVPELSFPVVEDARESPQELFLKRGRRFLRSITGLEDR